MWNFRVLKALACFVLANLMMMSSSSNAYAFKYHDNKVGLEPSNDNFTIIASAKFTIDDHYITSDQDPDDKVYNGQTLSLKDGLFTFKFGRKGSAETAKWFNDRVPDYANTFQHSADKLNFAAVGTLEVKIEKNFLTSTKTETYKIPNFAIAQGHTSSSNNWWVGGTECKAFYDHMVKCPGETVEGLRVEMAFSRGGSSTSGTNIVGVELFGTEKTLDWMGKLSDAVNLNDIVMPGSHDAGMSELKHCDIFSGTFAPGLVQTQYASIGEQLKYGARYFDIRVDYDHDELVTYHRTSIFGCNGQSLEAVLDQAVQFLTIYSSETAILKISHIRDRDKQKIKSRIDKFLRKSDYSDRMYINADKNVELGNVSLGDLRGKMLIVFSYSSYLKPSTGRFSYGEGFDGDVCGDTDKNITVCDKYSDTTDFDDMKEDQLHKLNEYGGLGKDHLFLVSWTLTGGTVISNARDANAKLNHALYDHITKEGKVKPNIVYIDAISGAVSEDIIKYNFPNDIIPSE